MGTNAGGVKSRRGHRSLNKDDSETCERKRHSRVRSVLEASTQQGKGQTTSQIC
jgi:hypothetical protein